MTTAHPADRRLALDITGVHPVDLPAVTDITNHAEAADDDIVDRLVEAFAEAGTEANGQGVLPDALAELAERLGGDDTDLGAVLLAIADIIEVVTDQ